MNAALAEQATADLEARAERYAAETAAVHIRDAVVRNRIAMKPLSSVRRVMNRGGMGTESGDVMVDQQHDEQQCQVDDREAERAPRKLVAVRALQRDRVSEEQQA